MSEGHTTDDADGGSPPFAGYDGLKPRELKKRLASHSQEELEGIERYERANKNRPVILDKLRFMRGEQPLPGYDQLSPEEIGSKLQEADIPTLKQIRDYERKFANRPEVLEETARIHRIRRADAPPAETLSYAPQSAQNQ